MSKNLPRKIFKIPSKNRFQKEKSQKQISKFPKKRQNALKTPKFPKK